MNRWVAVSIMWAAVAVSCWQSPDTAGGIAFAACVATLFVSFGE